MELPDLSQLLSQGQDLTHEQAYASAGLLASAQVESGAKASFLVELAKKGETAKEVSGIAKRFQELARDPGLDAWRDRAIDVCGTGGDRIGSFNISTTVVFVLAAAEVPVFKHGNRSITSKCGSANLLEALGVNLTADDATLRRSMEELGFCFMFAPAFHPAFKEIMPVRQQLAAEGQRTVFNVLGPLINPARPAHQLLGVFSPEIVELMAGVLGDLGLKSGMAVNCRLEDGRGMDELTVAGSNRIQGFGDLANESGWFSASDIGLQPAPLSDLLGGELDDNLRLLDRLLDGRAPKGLEDTVVANVAAALRIVGRCSSVEEGVEFARETLVGGATRRKIEQTRDFYSKA